MAAPGAPGLGGPAQVGPRLAGRLTAELISRSSQYMSCVQLYEIDLRGNKLGAIENLGVTQNQFDSIDLSDNAIVRLEGFPKLLRLRQLLLNNNRVAKIGTGLEASIPNLEALVLTNNKISELRDLAPLSSLPKLRTLCLLGNPVALKKEYRLYAISRCPALRVLDWKKVKQKEREDAEARFGSLAQQAEAAARGDNTFEPGEGLAEEAEPAQAQADGGGDGAGEGMDGVERSAEGNGEAAAKSKAPPTAEQLTALKAAVANAATLEEAWQLEQALRAGEMPSELVRKEGEAAVRQPGAGDSAAAMDEG